ncbi:hypothetical protein [Subtercola sp. RTI3]|uniref:hypothetical protein n=1 Tax=Subtercola sp. RTI3 TaxID=3048639 RepID=UPI002B237E1F|nr:hypothetical protein [Subtercola sp. RTI3]MEA9986146.1 hypothetical protein [Subtercola sp. RTI3]
MSDDQLGGAAGVVVVARPFRPNPFELVLWVMAPVLIAVSIAGVFTSAAAQYEVSQRVTCSPNGGCDVPANFVLRQILGTFAPETFAVGLLCIVVARPCRWLPLLAAARWRGLRRDGTETSSTGSAFLGELAFSCGVGEVSMA